MKTKIDKLGGVRGTLYEPEKTPLRSPFDKREEIRKMRQEMDEYKDFKKQQMFLGKRERILKSGWRHGIVGIDDADSHKT